MKICQSCISKSYRPDLEPNGKVKDLGGFLIVKTEENISHS